MDGFEREWRSVFDRDAARDFASTIRGVQTQFLNIDPFVDDVSNAFCCCQPASQKSQLWDARHVASNGCPYQKSLAIDTLSNFPNPYFASISFHPLTIGYPPRFGHPLALIRSYRGLASLSVTWLSGMVFKLCMWKMLLVFTCSDTVGTGARSFTYGSAYSLRVEVCRRRTRRGPADWRS